MISKETLARTARIARRSSLLALLVGASQAFGLQSAYAAKISSNYGTTCQVLENSHIKCWGAGKAGQLGDGKTESSATPVEVKEITTATSVSVGHESACAITEGGKVYCWGKNEKGQLGDGSTSNSSTPVEVEGLVHPVTSVSVGYESACATLANGEVDCWGDNEKGQLGDGTAGGPSSKPMPVILGAVLVPLSNATSVSVGYESACAITEEGGTVYCWGDNEKGQLGDGSTNESTTAIGVEGLAGATQVSVGYQSACATVKGGTVQCWGLDNNGQLGNNPTTNSNTAVQVQGLTTATAVSVGQEFACALLGSHTIDCWGKNSQGSLGDGSAIGSKVPVEVRGVSSASELSAGSEAACAALEDHHVDCWGSNYEGQLGYEYIPEYSTTPVEVGLLTQAELVSAGEESACAIQAARVWCWGSNFDGALGVGTKETEEPHSSLPLALNGITEAMQVSVGSSAACALLQDKQLMCWGAGEGGQLGDGSAENSPTPVYVKKITSAIQVSVGEGSACATLSSGEIDCWGNDGNGQLGNGHSVTTPQTEPAPVMGIKEATQVSMGSFSACAVLKTGRIKCWGEGVEGQLGNGKEESSSVPEEVMNIDNGKATQVSVGEFFACATLENHHIECWGNGGEGRLGNDSTENSSTPVEVKNIGEATQVSAGFGFACATLASGHVECWGYNHYGQLGDGKTENSSTPVEVKGIENATQVSAGFGFACATLASGHVECWGLASDGALGDGNPWSALAASVSGLLPFATTSPATSIGPTSATLNATVNPEGFESSCTFQYGKTTAYGSSVPCSQALGSATKPVPVSATLASLAPSTTYHYRVVVESTDGPVYGQDASFTTAPEPPKPTTTTTTSSTTSTITSSTTATTTTSTTTAATSSTKTTTTSGSRPQGNTKATLLSKTVKVNAKGEGALLVSCPAGSTPCAGRVVLRLAVVVRKRPRRKRRQVTLATATYHLKPGSKAGLLLKLSRLARRLLAKHHRLGVTADLVEKIQNRAVITTRKVTITQAKAKRRGVRRRKKSRRRR